MLGLAVVVVFLVFREFVTWYWKQSEQVKLLQEIRDSLKRLEAGSPLPLPGDGPAARLPGYTPYRVRPDARTWRDRVLERMPRL